MVVPNRAIKFTYEDYLNTQGDVRYELIDGELILSPAPRKKHQAVVTLLGAGIALFVRRHELGAVYAAPRDVALSNTEVVQPDILFISRERLHIDTDNEVWGAPDLVVEALSPSTAGLDRTYKRALYARYGVKEYWQVDPDAQTINVLILGENGFRLAAEYGVGDTMTSPTLPGFSINVADVF